MEVAYFGAMNACADMYSRGVCAYVQIHLQGHNMLQCSYAEASGREHGTMGQSKHGDRGKEFEDVFHFTAQLCR